MPTVHPVAQRPPFQNTGRLLAPPADNPNNYQGTEAPFLSTVGKAKPFRVGAKTFLVTPDVVAAFDAIFVRAVIRSQPFLLKPRVVDPGADNPNNYQGTEALFLPSPPKAKAYKPPAWLGLPFENPNNYQGTEALFTRGPLPKPAKPTQPQIFVDLTTQVAAAVEAIFVRALRALDTKVPKPKVVDPGADNPNNYAASEPVPLTRPPFPPPPKAKAPQVYFVEVQAVAAAVEAIFVQAARRAAPPFVPDPQVFVPDLLTQVAAVLEPIFVQAAKKAGAPAPTKPQIFQVAAAIVDRLVVQATPTSKPIVNKSRAYFQEVVSAVVIEAATKFFRRPSPSGGLRQGSPGSAEFDDPSPGGGIGDGSPGSDHFDDPSPGIG